jgi:hypothetical protein
VILLNQLIKAINKFSKEAQVSKNESVTKKHISMYDEQWAVVENVNHNLRLGNTSAALRYIVAQFAQRSEAQSPAQPATDKATAAQPM